MFCWSFPFLQKIRLIILIIQKYSVYRRIQRKLKLIITMLLSFDPHMLSKLTGSLDVVRIFSGPETTLFDGELSSLGVLDDVFKYLWSSSFELSSKLFSLNELPIMLPLCRLLNQNKKERKCQKNVIISLYWKI